MKNIYFIDIER